MSIEDTDDALARFLAEATGLFQAEREGLTNLIDLLEKSIANRDVMVGNLRSYEVEEKSRLEKEKAGLEQELAEKKEELARLK